MMQMNVIDGYIARYLREVAKSAVAFRQCPPISSRVGRTTHYALRSFRQKQHVPAYVVVKKLG